MLTNFIFFACLLTSSLFIPVNLKGSENLDAAAKEAYDSDDESLPIPVSYQRYNIIQATLDELGIYADEPLKRTIMEVTFGFNATIIKNLVAEIVEKSGGDSIDKKIRFIELEKAIRKHDSKREAAGKIRRLKQLASEQSALVQADDLPKVTIQPIENKKKLPKQYPLLKDVYHPDKELFIEVAEQLKIGNLKKEFPKGILLYGPPGVGKNEMIKAIVNESGCSIFHATASELVNYYQGSGAGSIKELFNQARAVDPSKGVIVVVDELQSVTPLSRNKEVRPAFKHSGLDYDNALTQLWIEFDRCINDENNNNILIVATCNEFDRIDERIRGRFDCVEFSYPDEEGTYEILKNKSVYYALSLSESELQEYAKKMQGSNGRDLAKFVKNAKRNLASSKNKQEALEQALRQQEKAKQDAQEKKFNSYVEKLKDEILRGTGNGIGAAIGAAIVGSALLAIKSLLGNTQGNNNAVTFSIGAA